MSKASEQLELLAEIAANLEDVKRLTCDRDALLAACEAGLRYRNALQALPVNTRGSMVWADRKNRLDELFFEWESKSETAITQAKAPQPGGEGE